MEISLIFAEKCSEINFRMFYRNLFEMFPVFSFVFPSTIAPLAIPLRTKRSSLISKRIRHNH